MGMTLAPTSKTMTPDHEEDGSPWAELKRERRALVVVDVVESVRLMQTHEDDVIRRWRRFIEAVRSRVLPGQGGRLVKSLGDGMLLDFAETRQALAAAFMMHREAAQLNQQVQPDAAIHLRVGVHVAEVVVDELDVFGNGVNLAARLASLCAPGEVVLSAEARQQVLDGLDAVLVDLGECYLKHIAEPVRAFRAAPIEGSVPVRMPRASSSLPLLAVATPLGAGAAGGLAELSVLADDLSVALARLPLWRVVSRLSTAALVNRAADAGVVAEWTQADYLVVLSLGPAPSRLQAELIDCRSAEAVWARDWPATGPALTDWQARGLPECVSALAQCVLNAQVNLEHAVALPNLPAYSVMLQAIVHMHGLSTEGFHAAGGLLAHLRDRHPRANDVRAWLAKWHFLQMAQAKPEGVQSHLDTARALLASVRADDPANGLALALEGHLLAFADRRLDEAEACLRSATQDTQNESLAWLFLANTLTHQGRSSEAVDAIEHARSLSPLDPMSYMFDHFASRAYLSDHRPEEALHFARRSIQANRLHLSGLAGLIVALMHAGQEEEARREAKRYLALRPGASVRRFADNHLASDSWLAKAETDALLAAGLPH